MTVPADQNPTEQRRPDRAALVVAFLIAVLAVVVAVNTYYLPSGIASYSRIGPRAFPYTIAICLALVAVATAIAAWRGDFPERLPDDYRPVGWIMAGLLFQFATISHIGFSLATGGVFAATAYAFGKRRLWFTYPVGVVLSLAIWLAFADGLNLVLPTGDLERIAQDFFRSLFAGGTPQG